MPTISDLNVRLGLVTTEFEKNLEKVTFTMRKSVASVNSSITAYNEKLELYGNGSRTAAEQTKFLKDSIDRLLKAGFKAASPQVQELANKLKAVQRESDVLKAKFTSMIETMRSRASSLSSLGDNLTIAVSAPLALFGGTAIKAAGEIESLRLALESTFVDAGRSVSEAKAELDALRQAALAPGLDFEQAVRGSIRLQSVGFAAEEARGILVQLANAVASTGGTALELDSVTRQFTQMIAKGRILQEDLTIIQENMPVISKAMEQAFGTRSADRLREMGITAEQFIAGITKQLETLPRVQGGITNALVNLTSGLKNQMARLGDEIDKTFNIGQVADTMIGALTKIVDYFTSLEDSSKRAVVQFALLAVAAGPVVKVISVLNGVGAQLVTGLKAVAGTGPAVVAFFKSIQSNGLAATLGITKLVQSWKALDLATKATTIGAVIAVVVALGVAFYTLTNRVNETVAAQKALSDVQKSAAESAAQEATKAEELVRVFTRENASRDDKRRAIEALKQLNPTYFGQLDAERATTEDVTTALKAYTKELIRAATVKQAVDKIAEIKTNLADLKDESKLTVLQTGFIATKSAIKSVLNPLQSLSAAQEALQEGGIQAVKNANDAKKAYEAQIAALQKLIDENQTAADITNQFGGAAAAASASVNGVAAAAGQSADNTKKMASALAAVNANLNAYEERVQLAGDGSRDTEAEIKLLSSSIDKLLKAGFSSASPDVEKLNQRLEDTKDTSAKLREEWDSLKNFFSDPTPTLPTVQAGSTGIQRPVADPTNVQDGAFGIVPPDAQGFRDTAQGIRDFTASIQASIEPMTTVQAIMNGLEKGTLSFSDAYEQAVEQIAESGSVVENAALAIGKAMAQSANEGATSFKQLAQAALGSAAKVARAYIIEGVASTVASALKTVPFPFNLAIGAAAGAAAGALFNNVIGRVGIPALASGGVISGPTLALLGEYPGARSNPEIAAPESKLRNIFRQEGAGQTEVYGIIRGEDILISSERAAANRRRVR